MSSKRRRSTWIAASAVALAGCSSEAPPPPAPAPTASTAPDELAPDELAEGPSSAFGLPLPALLRIDESGPTYVHAKGSIPTEAVANYIRSRVEAQNIVTGPTKTIFDDVKVKHPRGAQPPPLDGGAEAKPVLQVEVARVNGVTTLALRRLLRLPFKEGLTDDQRWERTGLTKEGKPVDPKKFE